MPEETVVADVEVSTDKVNDGKVDMEGADSETAEGSSTKKTEGENATGKVEKTASEGQDGQEEGSDDKDVEEAITKGQSIPFERFKQWNEKSKLTKTELATLKAENEEVAELLNNPQVFEAVLKAKGITDPKILSEKMREAGFEEGKTEEIPEDKLFEEFAKGLDLSKPQSWGKVMARMAKHFAGETVKPLMGEFSKKEVQAHIQEQETQAKALAKDTYGLEYGVVGKDEKNPNTAIGKMMAYLGKHPEDAKLGHVKILRLALADEGIKLGEDKGVKKEKDRQKALKTSAMEDDNQAVKEGSPDSSWSVSEIMAWRRKHGK